MRITIELIDLVTALSDAIDLVSNKVHNHHKRVAYISVNLGRQLGLNDNDLLELAIASSLHDIGALSTKERLEILRFEVENPERHAVIGYRLLSSFKPFTDISSLVRYHHTNFENKNLLDEHTFLKSNIINLADRVDISINQNYFILNQVKDIKTKINNHSNKLFKPEIVEAFNTLAEKECFWLDLMSSSIDKYIYNNLNISSIKLKNTEVLDVSKLFAHIIDFRSSFTATHSYGVAATAEKLAIISGFNEDDALLMKVAGYFHDLGKLAIPNEIIDKKGKLTEEEFNIIKSHTYYTRRILENIKGFEVINDWASLHHEKLDGNGYPFHYNNERLSIGSRIMAVADVFTAIAEERPYRNGMDKIAIIKVLNKMVDTHALDASIVNLLINNLDLINETRMIAQAEANDEYLMLIS